jgi:hypothetical protein
VLVDERVAESVAFGRELAAHGARTLSVHEDIGRLWRDELIQVCAAHGAIAGLTSHATLFVADVSARQLGARVRFQGEHDCRGRDVLTHSLRLHWELRGLGRFLAAANTQWPATLAARLAEMPAAIGHLTDERVLTDTPRSESHPGSLFSWLIA